MNKTQLQVITLINQTGDNPELQILQQKQQHDGIHTEQGNSSSFPRVWRPAAPFPCTPSPIWAAPTPVQPFPWAQHHSLLWLYRIYREQPFPSLAASPAHPTNLRGLALLMLPTARIFTHSLCLTWDSPPKKRLELRTGRRPPPASWGAQPSTCGDPSARAIHPSIHPFSRRLPCLESLHKPAW